MQKIMISIRDKELSLRGGDNLSVKDLLNIQLQALNTECLIKQKLLL